MDAPGHRNPPPLPPTPNGVPRFASVGLLSLRETMLALFLFPHIVLLSARQRPLVGRALLLVGLVIAACCLVLGFGRSASAMDQVAETAAWLGRQMGELRRTADGSLAWNRGDDVPTTLRHEGLRVDFVPAGTAFALKDLTEEDFTGLWISPREVRFWTLAAGQMSWPAFDANSQRETLNWNQRFPPGSVLKGDEFAAMARQWLRWPVPVLMTLAYTMVVLSIYLVFLTMFTVLPILLRRARAPGEGRVALCVNLYCSVVPVIVATAYHLAAPRTLDFSTLFVLAFLGYLIWAYSRVRRFLAGNGR